MIDPILRPIAVLQCRQLRTGRRNEGPVRLPLRPLRDPTTNCFDLLRRQLLTAARRRHSLVVARGRDASEQFAFRRIARHEPTMSVAVLEDLRIIIEPQLSLALFRIGAVTLKTGVGQDRPDIAIEYQRLIGRLRGGERRADQQQSQRDEPALARRTRLRTTHASVTPECVEGRCPRRPSWLETSRRSSRTSQIGQKKNPRRRVGRGFAVKESREIESR